MNKITTIFDLKLSNYYIYICMYDITKSKYKLGSRYF